MPSFSDIRADDLLRAARAAGLQPRSDADLLPLLLDLIGGLIPVDAWPTQMSRQQRTAHARETAQAGQAAADRPARRPPLRHARTGTPARMPRSCRCGGGIRPAMPPRRWTPSASAAVS